MGILTPRLPADWLQKARDMLGLFMSMLALLEALSFSTFRLVQSGGGIAVHTYLFATAAFATLLVLALSSVIKEE